MLKLFPTIEFAVTKFFAASCCTSKFPYKREAGNAGTNIKKGLDQKFGFMVLVATAKVRLVTTAIQIFYIHHKSAS